MTNTPSHSHRPHILFAGQQVDDIKIPDSVLLDGKEHGQLAMNIGTYRRLLIKLRIISKDKVGALLNPQSVDGGVIRAKMEEGMLRHIVNGQVVNMSIDCELPLRFSNAYDGSLDLKKLLKQVDGVKIEPGGNVCFNMAANAILANMEDVDITVADTTDPRENLPDYAVEAAEQRGHKFFQLPEIANRQALQFPFFDNGEEGTFGINSTPQPVADAVNLLLQENEDFRKRFRDVTSFVSSDPLYQLLDGGQNTDRPYSTTINPPTALRPDVATASYGRNSILPMNSSEARDFYQVVLAKLEDSELSDVEEPHFPSPFTTDGHNIDPENLFVLDTSLTKLTACNPPYKSPVNPVGFAYPITLGKRGGMLVGSGREHIVSFTTAPSQDKEKMLIDRYGGTDVLNTEEKPFEMGAGDAAAAFIAIFNEVDPIKYISPHMEGEEKDDIDIQEISRIAFVSIGARIVGNFLVRTEKCHWANIRPGEFKNLLDDVGKQALTVARAASQKMYKPNLMEVPPYGIRTLLWKLGSIRPPKKAQIFIPSSSQAEEAAVSQTRDTEASNQEELATSKDPNESSFEGGTSVPVPQPETSVEEPVPSPEEPAPEPAAVEPPTDIEDDGGSDANPVLELQPDAPVEPPLTTSTEPMPTVGPTLAEDAPVTSSAAAPSENILGAAVDVAPTGNVAKQKADQATETMETEQKKKEEKRDEDGNSGGAS